MVLPATMDIAMEKAGYHVGRNYSVSTHSSPQLKMASLPVLDPDTTVTLSPEVSSLTGRISVAILRPFLAEGTLVRPC
jgi:hypothetical protein